MDTLLWIAANYEELRRRCLSYQNTGVYDGEDALQDALAYTLPYLDTVDSPKGLVLRKAKRLLIDNNARGNGGHNNKCLPLENWDGSVDGVEKIVTDLLYLEEMLDHITQMSPVHREMMAYRLRESTQAEIARETGLTKGAIKQRMNRAITALKEVA